MPRSGRLEPEFDGRTSCRTLSLEVTSTSPHDERPAHGQQRRRVLRHHRERRQRASEDEIPGSESIRPLLYPGVHHMGGPDPGGGDRPLEEGGAASVGLDQGDARLGQRDREREPGEPGAGSQVSNGARAANFVELERHE